MNGGSSLKKQVLITGASHGIGKSIAFAFATEGYELHLTCKNSFRELAQLKHELETEYMVICHTYIGDISDYEFVQSMFASISQLDVLINNAGISYIGLLSDMAVDEWHRVQNTNLSSAFYCSKLAIPLMLAKKQGHIINISSVWGSMGASMEVAYSASKGGLNSFTKALAKELAPSHIRVNAIACGAINTRMNDCFTKEELNALCEEIPCDRLGTPEEAASLVLQITNAPSYMTGQIIALDGGWS